MKILRRIVIGVVAAFVLSGGVYTYLYYTPLISERDIQDSNPECSYLKMEVRYNKPLFDHTIVIDFDSTERGSGEEYALALKYISDQLRREKVDSIILANSGEPMMSVPVEVIRLISKHEITRHSDYLEIQNLFAEYSEFLGGGYVWMLCDMPSMDEETEYPGLTIPLSPEEWALKTKKAVIENFWSILFKLDQNKK